MIGVLVVTDNIKEWEDKFQACMKFTSERRDIYSNEFYFKNEVFSIYIVKSIEEQKRGYRWSVIILDKPIDTEIEFQFLRPSICSVVKTDNYYKELVEECKRRKQKNCFMRGKNGKGNKELL